MPRSHYRMEDLTFSVDSALLSELGEKLVETAHIALVELVKNAYDADATNVTVKILPHIAEGPEIQVIDDGTGMTFDDVKKFWMRIATTHKVEQNRSGRFGRPRTGSKGIGRFSCRRLGTKLKLITVARARSGRFERTEVDIDWKAFKPGTEVTTIKCGGSQSISPAGPTGTTLIISGAATDEWTKRGYNFLKRQLVVLVANRGVRRAGFSDDSGFNVGLDAPGFNETIENLRDHLIVAGWGDISATVDARGKATGTLRAMRIGVKSITHPVKFPNLAGVTIRIGLLPDRRDQIRDKSALSQGTLKEILEDWGGVYVRYNGFRVYPYGEPGNDWLDIDADRGLRRGTVTGVLESFAHKLQGVDPGRALLQLLSSRSHVGDVEIDERASGFLMKASREGFITHAAVDELKALTRFLIDWATIYRDYYLRLIDKDDSQNARVELERQLQTNIEPERVVASAVNLVRKEIKSIASQLPTLERQEVSRAVATATQAILKHDQSNREELRHLRLVASTSTLLLIFSHEVKSFLSELEQTSISLSVIESRVEKREAVQIQQIRDGLKMTKTRFLDLLGMTSLIAVDSRKAEPENLALAIRISKAMECFGLIARSYGIKTDVDGVPASLKVGPILEAELYAILLNVLSNAIKSVIAAGGDKRVEITAIRRNEGVEMHIRDTGVGLSEEHFDDVFIPFIADPDGRLYSGLGKKLNPEDKYIVGTGSGLGLSIVKEIVNHRKGTIQFVPPSAGWKADLEVILP